MKKKLNPRLQPTSDLRIRRAASFPHFAKRSNLRQIVLRAQSFPAGRLLRRSRSIRPITTPGMVTLFQQHHRKAEQVSKSSPSGCRPKPAPNRTAQGQTSRFKLAAPAIARTQSSLTPLAQDSCGATRATRLHVASSRTTPRNPQRSAKHSACFQPQPVLHRPTPNVWRAGKANRPSAISFIHDPVTRAGRNQRRGGRRTIFPWQKSKDRSAQSQGPSDAGI